MIFLSFTRGKSEISDMANTGEFPVPGWAAGPLDGWRYWIIQGGQIRKQ
jgi:hypothetical protein